MQHVAQTVNIELRDEHIGEEGDPSLQVNIVRMHIIRIHAMRVCNTWRRLLTLSCEINKYRERCIITGEYCEDTYYTYKRYDCVY